MEYCLFYSGCCAVNDDKKFLIECDVVFLRQVATIYSDLGRMSCFHVFCIVCEYDVMIHL